MLLFPAIMLRKFFRNKEDIPFVMELPPYRMPTLRNSLSHMWGRSQQYLRKMGGLILIASIVVWLLSYYPRPKYDNGESGAPNYEMSYMGRIGELCAPIFEPMDFGWRASVAIISGIPAKEIAATKKVQARTG